MLAPKALARGQTRADTHGSRGRRRNRSSWHSCAVLLVAGAGRPGAGARVGGETANEQGWLATIATALRGAEVPVRQDAGKARTGGVLSWPRALPKAPSSAPRSRQGLLHQAQRPVLEHSRTTGRFGVVRYVETAASHIRLRSRGIVEACATPQSACSQRTRENS
jgi:hypothetical protein